VACFFGAGFGLESSTGGPSGFFGGGFGGGFGVGAAASKDLRDFALDSAHAFFSFFINSMSSSSMTLSRPESTSVSSLLVWPLFMQEQKETLASVVLERFPFKPKRLWYTCIHVLCCIEE
jgi:hypothetical protein